jgi:hypothetical protein
MMDKNPFDLWRVFGVFSLDRRERIDQIVDRWRELTGLDLVPLRLSSKHSHRPGEFALENMSANRSNDFLKVMQAITPKTVLILDDIEVIRNYPQSMTRNILNHITPRARYKIIGGNALVMNEIGDLYAPFACLDKRILHNNHYWAFVEDHREVSIFDGHSVVGNKDPDYLAAKISPFIYFDLEPVNTVQELLYRAVRAALVRERVQDLSPLRLV